MGHSILRTKGYFFAILTTPMPRKTQPKSDPYPAMIWVFPFIYLLLILFVRGANFEFYRELVSEDGVLETLQFVFYFATGCVLWYYLRRLGRTTGHELLKIAYLGLGAGFFALSLEEISWGQRLLHFAAPGYFVVHNVQKEVTIHNLSAFQPYLHGTYILTGLILGLLLPLVSLTALPKKYRHYVPSWSLSAYFVPLSLVYIVFILAAPVSLTGPNMYGFIWRDQEVVETLLTLGLLLWTHQTLRHLHKSSVIK